MVLASFGMGNLVQSNSMAQALEGAVGVPKLLTGIAAATLTALALAGGLNRLGKVCERLVPVMAVLYLVGGLWVIFAHAARLPAALGEIVGSALDGTALFGGGGAAAIQYGLSRGVCTNEAGLGSTPMIHCASGNDDPAKEGNWGIFEVFFATVVVCTITALVILTSGVMGDGRITGALLTAQAFSTVMCAGSVLELRPVWQISDIFNALMAWPSLFSLLLWSERILQCGPEGKRRRKQAGAA